jgi:hypothetical protein
MSIKGLDLEELREIFADRRVWIDLALIEQVEPSIDQSEVLVQVKLLFDEDQIIARMTWDLTGPDAGLFSLPEKNDLVMVAYVDGSEDYAYIIRNLTSSEDPFPARVLTGATVLRALGGKALNLSSDTKATIGRGGLVEESEALVLGGVLKTAQEALYDEMVGVIDDLIAGPIGIGNIGQPVPTHPGLMTKLTARKTQIELDKLVYITTTATNWLSQIAYTER